MIGTMRRGMITLLLTLWQISTTAVRVFVWGSIRENAINLRPFQRAIRVIGVVGLAVIGAFLLGLLFSDSLRLGSELALLPNDSTSTRGLSVPRSIIPLTLLALALGWGYMLAGALHARPLIRWGIFVLFLLQFLAPLAAYIGNLAGSLQVIVGILLVGLVVCLIVFPRVALPLPVEWSVVLLLCSGLLVSMLYGALQFERLSGGAWLTDMLSGMVLSHFGFIMPLLVIAGLGWADFALEASRWVAQSCRRHASGMLLRGILLLLLGYRAYGFITDASEQPINEQLLAWAGAAMLLAGLVGIAFIRMRMPAGRAISPRLITLLALLLPAIQLLILIAVSLSSLLVFLQITPAMQRLFDQTTAIFLQLSEWEYRVRPLLLALVGLGLAAYARRRHATLATFGLVLAWTQLCTWLTRVDEPLGLLHFAYGAVDRVAFVGLAILALVLLVRRSLTDQRALQIIAIVVLLALLNQTAFLDNPFSPLFGFAGVAFLVFGIVWNILTAGNGFANTGTPGLPRESRLLLYLGYVLLTVNITHWYLISHNITMQERQSTINEVGFLTIGLPLAYLAIVELGKPLIADDQQVQIEIP